MADPDGSSTPPPPPPLVFSFLNILWKWNNLVSVSPNYFIFMGYLRQMRSNQQSKPPHLYTYKHPFQKSWINPCKLMKDFLSSEWVILRFNRIWARCITFQNTFPLNVISQHLKWLHTNQYWNGMGNLHWASGICIGPQKCYILEFGLFQRPLPSLVSLCKKVRTVVIFLRKVGRD